MSRPLTDYELGWWDRACAEGKPVAHAVFRRMLDEIWASRRGVVVHNVSLSTSLDMAAGTWIAIGGPITPHALEMLRLHLELLRDVADAAPYPAARGAPTPP